MKDIITLENLPLDLTNLILTYVCNCNIAKCDFCNIPSSKCYLKICAFCKKNSCGLKNCPKFNTDFIISYQKYCHKKCCHKCYLCKIY